LSLDPITQPYMKTFLFVFLFLAVWSLSFGQQPRLEIDYCNMEVIVDGNPSEWSQTKSHIFTTPTSAMYRNTCDVRFGWDEQSLFICMVVKDNYLVGLEKADSLKRLHFNDGIEVYIDSHNDSKDTLDLNDYQFMVDLKGGNVIFRGDRLNLLLKQSVPKDSEIANIVFQVAATQQGTINNNTDIDSGFVVECAIPWASIGIKPVSGEQFAMDFCVNDNDTVIDFHRLPEGPLHGYLAYSLAGVSDFGFPDKWLKVKLAGKASELKKMKSKYAGKWFPFLVISMLILSVLAALFLVKIFKLKQIPAKTGEDLSPILDFVINKPVGKIEEKGNNELFTKAREYLMVNLDKSIKPEALAQELGVSLRQLQRVFRDGLDTTPNTFIILIKLEAAAEMLKQNNLNISEVAYSVGFNDPSYFSRVFKKYFNISPSEMADTSKSN